MVYGMAWLAWHGIWYGLAGKAYGLTRHGVVYGIPWRAWHGIRFGIVGMAWYMIRHGGNRIWYMVWPGGHGMLNGMVLWEYHGIWYGMAWREWCGV